MDVTLSAFYLFLDLGVLSGARLESSEVLGWFFDHRKR